MKFKHNFKSRATLQRRKFFDFFIPLNHIEKIRKATKEDPYYFYFESEGCHFKAFMHEGKIYLKMFHSFDTFLEEK